MTPTPIRVLVVDDHEIVRQGICSLLSEIDDIEVVAEAGDGRQAIDLAIDLKPDVILMDLIMPEMDGIEAIRYISTRLPEARVLVVTSYSGANEVFPAIKAGALGFLLKDTKPMVLVEAIRQVHQGQPSLHPRIARMLLQELNQTKPKEPSPEPPTVRELEVLTLLASGKNNLQIAEELVITEATVRSHVSHILDKLHLANRVQATLYALRQGLISLEDDP